QLRYQPRPDLTPTDSATTRVRKDAPSPMNKPMKIFGTAAGIATRKIRYAGPAPSVRATSREDARVLEMPEAVTIVSGNHRASAIKPTAETIVEGATTIAKGIHAVAGIGPTTLSSGIPQYRTEVDHPMQTPLISPMITPRL